MTEYCMDSTWRSRRRPIACSRPAQSHWLASNPRRETPGSRTAFNPPRSPPGQAGCPGSSQGHGHRAAGVGVGDDLDAAAGVSVGSGSGHVGQVKQSAHIRNSWHSRFFQVRVIWLSWYRLFLMQPPTSASV